jgi:hypothetical protein
MELAVLPRVFFSVHMQRTLKRKPIAELWSGITLLATVPLLFASAYAFLHDGLPFWEYFVSHHAKGYALACEFLVIAVVSDTTLSVLSWVWRAVTGAGAREA